MQNIIIGFTVCGTVTYILALLTKLAFNSIHKFTWFYILLLGLGNTYIVMNLLRG